MENIKMKLIIDQDFVMCINAYFEQLNRYLSTEQNKILVKIISEAAYLCT